MSISVSTLSKLAGTDGRAEKIGYPVHRHVIHGPAFFRLPAESRLNAERHADASTDKHQGDDEAEKNLMLPECTRKAPYSGASSSSASATSAGFIAVSTASICFHFASVSGNGAWMLAHSRGEIGSWMVWACVILALAPPCGKGSR